MNDAFAVLPDESVAVQCTVVVSVAPPGPSGNVSPELWSHVTGTDPSCASLALTVNVTAAPAGLVAFAVIVDGTVITGGVVSPTTVMWNVFVDVFPRVSDDVHVTVVVPIGNVDPEGGLHVTGWAPSTRSVALAV